jgi:hypothetical protein
MTFGERVGAAFRAFFSLLSAGRVPHDMERHVSAAAEGASPQLVEPAPAAVEATGTPADGAVQLLAVLQRDARLIDFLMEDLSSYPDAQVGAAVREVHANARKALQQYVEIEPVLEGAEDQPVTLPSVEPDEVKLVGRGAPAPPVRGTLRHRGWRGGKVSLPALPRESARRVIAPAEVEIA